MRNHFSPTRRRVLMGLVAVAPATLFLRSGITLAADQASVDDDSFLRISRTITGTDTLSSDTSQRIKGLLAERIDYFMPKLKDLAGAMQKTGGSREEMLAGLTDEQVDFALSIAKPWYLGYVGTPSGAILEDDAEFTTFLEAQAYTKIANIVPLETYPPDRAGWWSAVPEGVDASDLPRDADSWSHQPRQTYTIAAPDPAWRAYATGDYDSIEAAQAALITASDQPKTDDNSDTGVQ